MRFTRPSAQCHKVTEHPTLDEQTDLQLMFVENKRSYTFSCSVWLFALSVWKDVQTFIPILEFCTKCVWFINDLLYINIKCTTSIDYSEFKTASPASINPLTLLFRLTRYLLLFSGSSLASYLSTSHFLARLPSLSQPTWYLSCLAIITSSRLRSNTIISIIIRPPSCWI